MIEQESKPKKVSRVLPIFIDIIILTIQLCIIGGYFYMAFIYGSLNEVQCKADMNSNNPIQSKYQEAVDVTEKFKRAIEWGFWMSFSIFIRAILAQIALYFKVWVLLWISYVLFAINISLVVMLFVFMNIWRWSHSGRVCSGDYTEDINTADEAIYLVTEGRFLKIILLLIYLVFILAVTTIVITACFLMKSTPDGNEGGSNTDRVTALTMPLDHDYDTAMRRGSMNGETFHKKQREGAPDFGRDTESDLNIASSSNINEGLKTIKEEV